VTTRKMYNQRAMREIDVTTQLATEGYLIVPDVLDAAEVAKVRTALILAGEESERRGRATFIEGLDPNPSNVRVFNLLDLSPVFRELIMHPVGISLVERLIGKHFLISNFTANIAKPGSRSMAIHADQAIAIPEPWESPWAVNIVWCLDDMYHENGATLFLPGSHLIQRVNELPQNIRQKMQPFEAKAGSIIAMDGRLWHTSGENRTVDKERALLFGYYAADFVRGQINWNAALSSETIEELPTGLFERLGLGENANLRHGAALTAQIPENQ
jgi:hypothetical protein